MDKEAVVDRIHDAIDSGIHISLFMDVLELLEGQPKIVRCRDCKNGGLDSSGLNGYWCSAHTEWHNGDWFCANGERKEGR